MDVECFSAKDLRTALKRIKSTLGENAVIHCSRKIDGGVEVEASCDKTLATQESTSNAAGTPQSKTTLPAADALANTSTPWALGALPRVNTATLTEPSSLTGTHTLPTRPIISHSSRSTWQDKPQTNPSHAALALMQHEMALLRQLLEENKPSAAAVNPYQSGFRRLAFARFCQLGFTPRLIEAVIEECDINDNFSDYWNEACQLLACQIPVNPNDPINDGGMFAFIGPTGVGKTTTIAKFASRFVMEHGNQDIALITTDCFRVAGKEQLGIYGQILNIPVVTVRDASQLTRALDTFAHKKCVLIDTAGISQRDVQLAERLALFHKEKHRLSIYCVLSATSSYTILEQSIRRFGELPLTGAVLTKLDEAIEIGKLISIFIERKMRCDYVTTGQHVPHDLQLANGQLFMNQLLALEHLPSDWTPCAQAPHHEPQGVVNAC